MRDDGVARSGLDTELWGHTTGGGCPLEVSILLLCALMDGVSPSGEYRANYIFLVSLSPRMKVALFSSHKIDTYTYE